MTPENDSKKNSECDLTIIRKLRYKNHVPFPTTTNRKRPSNTGPTVLPVFSFPDERVTFPRFVTFSACFLLRRRILAGIF